jgi:hypothetical protein
MIYSSYTFMDCYSAFSLMQAYFLPIHRNREVSVLGKLPYIEKFILLRIDIVILGAVCI